MIEQANKQQLRAEIHDTSRLRWQLSGLQALSSWIQFEDPNKKKKKYARRLEYVICQQHHINTLIRTFQNPAAQGRFMHIIQAYLTLIKTSDHLCFLLGSSDLFL